MPKNRSTKDLGLSSNERLYLKRNSISPFNFPLIKNLTSNYVKFYTFHAGFKKKHDDLLLAIFNSKVRVVAAYSKTSTPSAPIIWDKKNNKGFCKVLIVNSGNANAHTGDKGIEAINIYAKIAAKKFNCTLNEILVSSTGVIGELLDQEKIIKTYPLIDKSRQKNLLSAAKAIMTTDTFAKTAIKKIKLGTKEVRIFGFAKGSGMIFPNMGTMLAYIFIEANISKSILKNLLNSHLDQSFNSISVDGDTSTSDTVMLFSLADHEQKKIINKTEIKKISLALKDVMFQLALQIVCDGEGISKLMIINISGANNYVQASSVAFSIANSTLVKTAVAGEDANWGRLIMAIGKADNRLDQKKIKLKFGNLLVATKGQMYNAINIKKLNTYMKNKIIQINVELGIGTFKRTVYASDLTHEYIRINSDYRS
jgi:glutamate N-acetyltransferase/amino-acid N-acetyltransferase